MRKNNYERNVVRPSNMDNYSPKVEFNEPVKLGTKKHSGNRGLGMFIATILCFGLLGTMFFAYQNRDTKDKFVFFSPSQYLSKLTAETVFIPEGRYPVFGERSGKYAYRGYIEYNGNRIYSTNTLGMLNVSPDPYLPEYLSPMYADNIGATFEFIFGDNSYQAKGELYPVEVDGQTYLNYILVIDVTAPYSMTIGDMPSLDLMSEKWSNIEDIFDVWPAIQATAIYVTDTVSYYSNLILNLAPWNAAKSSESENVDIPWRDDVNEYVSP